MQGMLKPARRELDPYKSMGPDTLNPKVVRELSDVLFIEIREIQYVWKKTNDALIFKTCLQDNQETTSWDSPTLVFGKSMAQVFLEHTSGHVKEN